MFLDVLLTMIRLVSKGVRCPFLYVLDGAAARACSFNIHPIVSADDLHSHTSVTPYHQVLKAIVCFRSASDTFPFTNQTIPTTNNVTQNPGATLGEDG